MQDENKQEKPDYKAILKECDEHTQQIEEMMDEVMRMRVQCALMELELATVYNPYVETAQQKAIEACKKCESHLAELEAELKEELEAKTEDSVKE